MNQWHADRHLGATAKRAGQLELATMRIDQHLGDGESEASATLLAGACFIRAVEAVENSRQVLGCDATPGVGDLDLRTLAVSTDANVHLAASWSVLDRVVDQDDQDL